MLIRRLVASICTAITVPLVAHSPDVPVVAFVDGTSLTLASSSGEVTLKIDLNRPVYNFALSQDRNLLVTVAPDTENGGNLSLINLQTHAQKRLTEGHLYFKAKELNKGETEVYDDPQFSPDGRKIAFAIHTNNPGDANDAINDSGPIAVMDLQTRRVRVLKSTENIEGQGFCFANTPMWSRDGKWILFNCEDGAFISDVRGTTLRDLKLGTEEKSVTAAVSWVGNSCVLYTQRAESNYEGEEVQLLNLHTSKSQNPAKLFAFPKWVVAGLTEASDSAFIRQTDSGLNIETGGKNWTLPGNLRGSSKVRAAHIIGDWSPSTIPHECK